MNLLARIRSDDLGKLVLRLGLAFVVLLHGIFKLQHGVAWMAGPLDAFGLPAFVAYGTYVAEVVAPLMLIAGYQVQLAALIIAFDMLMAVVLVLRGQLFAIKESGGGWGIETEGLIFFSALALFFTGSGRFALRKDAS